MNRITIASFAAIASIGAGLIVIPGAAAQRGEDPAKVMGSKSVNQPVQAGISDARVVRVVYPSHLTAQR